MNTRQKLLAMTAAAGLAALPALAIAQGSSGSSMMPQTTQTTPQQGPLGGNPGARAGANAGQATGQTIPGNNAGSPQGGNAPDRQTPPHMQTQGQAPGQTPGSGTPPAANVARPSGASAGATTGALAVDSAAIRSGRRASKLIGSSVYNENNESIGEVDDIVLPANGGAPVAVVSVGGFLGIGAKLVAVPYERLRSAGERNRWTLTGAASRDDLNRLPTFSYDGTAGRS